jgi:hypothetical protein
MKIQMLLLPIFFLNFLLVELSSASKRLKEQTPTMSYRLEKGIYFTFQKEEKNSSKKAQKTSIFQAFLDQDINSSSGNFIVFTQA